MLINTAHILAISKPLETYINRESGFEINRPNITITYVNKDYTVVFFKSISLAKKEFDKIRQSVDQFIEIDMTFTDSIM